MEKMKNEKGKGKGKEKKEPHFLLIQIFM